MTALQRLSLREQIKDVILERIINGDYKAGDRLVESRISQELKVSQSSVREALRDLEQLGFLVYEFHRGCSVRAFSPHDLLEAYPVRAALEALAAREAARRIDAVTLERLTGLVEGMIACADDGRIQEQALLNVEFHRTIVDASGNTTLVRQWALLEPSARTYLTTLASRASVDLRYLAERHIPILDALRRGDGEEASRALHAHLMEAAALLAEGIGQH
jgi:DNA-binding GntR family transcriptional regulator